MPLTVLNDRPATDSISKCEAIGLWALSRDCSSCTHKTKFCKKHCYKWTQYRMYSHTMVPYDVFLKGAWQQLTADSLRAFFDRKRAPVGRFRLAKIRVLCRACPIS